MGGVRNAATPGAGATVAARRSARTVAAVNQYVVPRTRAWLSEEELAAAIDCAPAVNETLRGKIRWSAPTS